MSKKDSYRAIIPPVLEETPRTLWSVMIPTYNCAKYLRQTLSSVLAQDPGVELMQIAVVDDCSTKDDPEAIVQELGQGRVEFYRQPHNVGHTKNFQSCLERSRGQLVHLLHGDDYVLDGFYHQMQQAFITEPNIGAAFCRHIFMDEQGHWQGISELLQSHSGVLDNWLERILTKQYIQTPSIVVRRKVYEQLGGFDQRLVYYEDWEMWVRIALQHLIWFEVQPLAVYRTHSASNSGCRIRTGENIRDVRRGTEIVQAYLPAYLSPDKINHLISKNHEIAAQYALDTAQKLLLVNDIEGEVAQLKEALRCSRSMKVIQRAVRLLLKAGIYRIRHIITRRLTVSS